MQTILFFHTSMRQSWHKELAGAYRFAKSRGWRVQVVEPTVRPVSIAALVELWKPAGCLVECSGAASDYFKPDLFGSLPTVFIGRDPRTLPASASFVNPSPVGAGEVAAKELMATGLLSFAFAASPRNHFWSRDREAGFKRMLHMNGFSCATFARKARFRNDSDRVRHLSAWLRERPKPCGILAENDYLATELLDLASRLHLKVPQQLAIIGVDNDSALCENASPSLSSVYLDFERAGFRASEILSDLIADPSRGPIRETYPALGVVRRGSTPAGAGSSPRIEKAMAFIREKACAGITAADVARLFPGSRRTAELDFRRATGRTILAEIRNVRFEHVEMLLRSRSRQLKAIAGLTGWKTENALRTAFLKRYGLSMRAWRARFEEQTGRAGGIKR